MYNRERQHENLGTDGMPNDKTTANLRGSRYQVKPTPRGFTAYCRSVAIGDHDTEQGARFIAAKHCHAQAKKDDYITICPVDMLDGTTLSLVKSYSAKVKPDGKGLGNKARGRIKVFMGEDGEMEELSSGEYYVCHGLTPLTHFHAKLRFYPEFEVGQRKGIFTVTRIWMGADQEVKLARLTVQCDCGKSYKVASRDFNPTYFRPKTQCPGCPAYQKILDRGSRVDEYGDIVDKFGLPENFNPVTGVVVASLPPTPEPTVLDGMPHRDAPYSVWKAYHAKNDAKAAAKEAKREAKARGQAEEKAVADANKWELGLDDENI